MNRQLEIFGPAELLRTIKGQPCWHVSCGDTTGSSFERVCGDKRLRKRPLKNPTQPFEFQMNESEFGILVWCDWRLEHAFQPLTSSDDTLVNRMTHLRRLVGTTIRDVRIEPPCWDMRIDFSDDFSLAVFCNHVNEGDGFDGNWDFFSPRGSIYAGPGTSLICKPG